MTDLERTWTELVEAILAERLPAGVRERPQAVEIVTEALCLLPSVLAAGEAVRSALRAELRLRIAHHLAMESSQPAAFAALTTEEMARTLGDEAKFLN